MKVEINLDDLLQLKEEAKSYIAIKKWWMEEEARADSYHALLKTIHDELRESIRDENGIAIKAEFDKIKHILTRLEAFK